MIIRPSYSHTGNSYYDKRTTLWYESPQGSVSISNETPYHKILQSLEAKILVIQIVLSLWNLTSFFRWQHCCPKACQFKSDLTIQTTDLSATKSLWDLMIRHFYRILKQVRDCFPMIQIHSYEHSQIVVKKLWHNLGELMQERRNSNANALELRLSCTNLSILSTAPPPG